MATLAGRCHMAGSLWLGWPARPTWLSFVIMQLGLLLCRFPLADPYLGCAALFTGAWLHGGKHVAPSALVGGANGGPASPATFEGPKAGSLLLPLAACSAASRDGLLITEGPGLPINSGKRKYHATH